MQNLIPDNKIEYVTDQLKIMHPDARCELDHENNYQLLIAVVLSAQTTDVSVNKITPGLFDAYPTPADLAAARPEDVENSIRTIGLYKNKARNIVKLAQELELRFDGKVPGDYDSLVSLPGVGRKTANVVLAEAFGEQRIAVDTHVFRVANRIGLCDEKDVLKTEEALMRRLPQNRWTEMHHCLIIHGRRICTARNPKCGECLLNDICVNNAKKNT